jgi:hypothetical protein
LLFVFLLLFVFNTYFFVSGFVFFFFLVASFSGSLSPLFRGFPLPSAADDLDVVKLPVLKMSKFLANFDFF